MSATAGLLLRGRRVVGARTCLLLGTAPESVVEAVERTLVAGPEAKWYHRADCLLVEGRHWPTAPMVAHERAGRKPCPACKPNLALGS
jgi:hypothetical protein